MKLRICIFTTVHSPFDTRIFHKQAKTLVQAGYDVVVIARHHRDEVVDGVKVVALPKPENRLQRMVGLTWRAFRLALCQRADIYHFHDPELLPIGALLKLFTRNKVIYDVHENYPLVIRTKPWLPSILRGLIADAFDGFERFIVRFLDGIVAATDGIGHRFPEQKTTVVRNYPLLTYMECTRPGRKEGAHQEEHILIYTGGLADSRGIYELVKALEFIGGKHQVRLRLLGKFVDEGFERQIRSLKGFARVDFPGWVPYDEVFLYLQRADIGLVVLHPATNYVDALPTKLFEYMSAGLPVIASYFPLWREIVEGNRCGIVVNPLDLKDIAGAIEYLLERPELRREMGENGRRAVQEKYNWEVEARNLAALYKKLLPSQRKRCD